MDKSPYVKKMLDVNILKLSCAFELDYDLDILNKLDNDKGFIKNINNKIAGNSIFRIREFNNIYQFSVFRNLLYYLVRVLKPRVVVETGVFHGLTSAWILKGLHENGNGKLLSIDLPRRDWNKFFPDKEMGPGAEGEDSLPANDQPGWIIPDNLKENWELYLGPSQQHLEKCLSSGNVDLFIHDSDHSYHVMEYECQLALKMAPKAIHVIDNFDMNNYFFNFLLSHTKGYYDQKVSYMLAEDVSDALKVSACTALYKLCNHHL